MKTDPSQYGLIGKELAHSFSPAYFTEKFESEQIHATYSAFPLNNIDLFPSLIQSRKIDGLNVTIPYKESIIKFLDILDPAAEAIGAVNTIGFAEGKLIGYNTDYQGFYDSLIPIIKSSIQINAALILGTGGASKAIQYALDQLHIQSVHVSRRPTEKQISYNELEKSIIEDHLLIINTTPLGTYPNMDQYPDIPYEFLTKEHILYDLVYNPSVTAFMNMGKQQGAHVVNGYQMLINQAELAWKIWQSNP